MDKYVDDPLSGFDLADDTVPQLFSAADRLADPAVLAGIRSDLPILIVSGEDDPLSGKGQLVGALAQRYRDAGVVDVTLTVYPEARHEIFNETNRDEITADVVAWLAGAHMTIDFTFSPDQQEFADVLAGFASAELLPRYGERSASIEFPFDALKQLGDLGVLGIGLPERWGGTGEDDPIMLGLATEMLAHGDVNVASAPIQVGLVGAQLLHGTEEVQERYLPRVIAGEENLAIALTEPGSGSDASALRMTAAKVRRGLAAQRREDRDQLGDERDPRPSCTRANRDPPGRRASAASSSTSPRRA